MTVTDDSALVPQPAFCRRADCEARRDRAFCSRCGADIAAYMAAITQRPEPVVSDRSAVDQPTAVLSRPAPRMHAPRPQVQTDRVRPSREPVVLFMFGAATLVGVLAGYLLDLV